MNIRHSGTYFLGFAIATSVVLSGCGCFCAAPGSQRTRPRYEQEALREAAQHASAETVYLMQVKPE